MFRVSTLDFDDLPRADDGGIDFNRDFFGKPVSLTVSGQRNAAALALAFRDT
jgi:asparaginyl-tRNA synthetase